MAQVFGTSGRNAAEESHKRTKRLLAYGFCGIAALALLGGYAIGATLPSRRLGFAWVLLIDSVLLGVIVLIAKWSTGKVGGRHGVASIYLTFGRLRLKIRDGAAAAD
jgi:hypothetical protein